MPLSDLHLPKLNERSNWMRLRTFVTLRWFAIAGQSIAMMVAILVYRLEFAATAAALVILTAILANLFCLIVYPMNKRMTETEAAFWLIFDLFQLGLLLFLTGGLNNPFAMLVIVPVTISATALNVKSTVALGVFAILIVTLLSLINIPLVAADGRLLTLPLLLQFGFWAALMISLVFLAFYARQVTSETNAMNQALLATQLALSREQRLTDLGGVVAATAHELGTPLATIKLVSSELREELQDQPTYLEDIELIRSQADRCRDILRSMGRAGKDDLHLHRAPLETVVREAAEPHLSRGKEVVFEIGPMESGGPAQPSVLRRPEIIHGLRNLIQNAVDFCKTTVTVSVHWSDSHISVVIADDGPGFPGSVIGRIGDPFVKSRRSYNDAKERPEYEGMGLGLFIAKTLLERSGASLKFSNGRLHDPQRCGANIAVRWPLATIEAKRGSEGGALGQNQPNSL